MGLSTMRALCLAVLVLACLYHPGFAAKKAALTEVLHTTYMEYSDDPALASGGIFSGFSTAPEQVFMWTVKPGSPYILSWNETALLTSSNVPLAQKASASNISESSSYFLFHSAQRDDNYMYVVSTYAVFKIDPANIEQLAENATLPNMPEPTTSLRLFNATHNMMVVSALGSTNLAIINLNNLNEVLDVELELEVPSEDGAGAAVSLGDDHGYLLYPLFDSIVLSRISLTAGSYEADPAIEITNVYAPNAAPMFHDSADNMLYLLVQNVDADKPVLLQVNLTAVDNGTGLTTLVAEYTESAARAVGVYGDAIRALVIEDPDNLVPTGVALSVDLVGGQAFVTLDSGLVMRVNVFTMELLTPSLLASGDTQNPGGQGLVFIGDATSSMGNRALLVWTKLTVVTAEMGSACPDDCGESLVPARGQCVFGVCECIAGRHGDDCSGLECTSDCGASLGQGACGLAGACECEPEWTFESNCTARQCPSNCYGNGECNDDFTCSCSSLWAGADCSIAAFLACDTFTTEESCVAKFGACGWCTDTKNCTSGNLDGPYQGTCKGWYTGGKEQVGLLAAAIILIVVFGFMLLVGIFSAMPMDYVTASILVDSSLLTTDFLKEAYWRDERSAKTWKMFDLFQFISLYSFLNVSFPTQLIQFSRYFHWANLMLPMPYGYEVNNITHPNRLPSSDSPSAATVSSNGLFGMDVSSRGLLNVEQYANSVKLDTEHIFYGTMFWFAMLCLACLLIYAIYAFFMWIFLRKKEPNISTVLLQKVFYLLTRLALIGYMPINFTAAWHIREGSRPHKGSIAAAVFAIIIFGILPIAFNAIVVWNKGKELLFLYLKLRFGALYSVLHYEKARFNLVVLARKLLIALVLGFLAAPSTTQSKYVYAQVFIIVGLYVIYMAVLAIVRPYLDQVHLVLDLIMSTLFAIAVGIAVLHKTSPSTAGQIIAGVCIILVFLACLLAFVHSWWNIIGRNTYPWIMCGPKYAGLDDKPDGDDDEELDTAAAIKQKKQKEAALAGVMPSAKPSKAHQEPEEDTSEVDSSLQSSSDDDEDDDDEQEEAAAPADEESEQPEESEKSEESEQSEESEDSEEASEDEESD